MTFPLTSRRSRGPRRAAKSLIFLGIFRREHLVLTVLAQAGNLVFPLRQLVAEIKIGILAKRAPGTGEAFAERGKRRDAVYGLVKRWEAHN